jgi:hypothetical protein
MVFPLYFLLPKAIFALASIGHEKFFKRHVDPKSSFESSIGMGSHRF